MSRAIISTLHRANRSLTLISMRGIEARTRKVFVPVTRFFFRDEVPRRRRRAAKFFRPQRSTTTRTNRLTTICIARKVSTPFYHARPAAHSLRFCRRVADHPSIPDGSIPPRPFLAQYDDSTPPGSSPSHPKSATPDQRCLQARASARFGTSADGGGRSARIPHRHRAQGNYRRQTHLRVDQGFRGRRLIFVAFQGAIMAAESILNRKALRDY